MKAVLLIALAIGSLAWKSTQAQSQIPAAIVEQVTAAGLDIEFLDYVRPGRRIDLKSGDRIVLGYLSSCRRETITGGTIVVGRDRSVVEGGEVMVSTVECDSGRLVLASSQTSQSAVAVLRELPLGEPQLTIHSTAPLFVLTAPGTLSIKRLDRAGDEHHISRSAAISQGRETLDIAGYGILLEPGGIYRASISPERQIVFQVAPSADRETTALLSRLVQL